jgi:hypothetical protein
MLRIFMISAAAIALGGALSLTVPSSGLAGQAASPTADVKLPSGYRDWKLISVAHEEGSLNDMRAILGNDAAIDTVRAGRRPFPDGSIIARLAWSYDALAESEQAFGRPQSFIAGAPKNGVQFMIKDARKFAATGGWGFVQFNDGELADPAMGGTACFSCHEAVEKHDFVFNRYSQ